MTKEKTIPTAPYDLYLYGLRAIMENDSLSLEEAKEQAIKDAKKVHGFEHIPLIKTAYKKLKEETNPTH